MRKTALPLLAALWLLSPGAALLSAFAQAPPPVPALPDSERRTSYSITATTCACSVNFALYGDSTDYQNWVEVWLNGVNVAYNDPTFGWAITSPTGPLATIPRPVTDGVLTFTGAQTGTVQIVGARRPRRTTQFSENRGVAARDLNQALTDVIAQNRETWDKINDFTGRALIGPPGQSFQVLPGAAACANKFVYFDPTGLIPLCSTGTGAVNGPGPTNVGDFAVWANAAGTQLGDLATVPISRGGTGQTTAPAARAAAGLNIDELTSHGDSAYVMLSTDRVVGTNAAFTASRAWTLPAASSLNPGQALIVADFAGGVTAINTLVITRAGSDAINGGTTATIAAANGAYILFTDGVSKWTAQSVGAASSGGVSAVTVAAGPGITATGTCTITTSGTCTVTSPGTSVAGDSRNLKITQGSTTTLTVAADEIVTETALGGQTYKEGGTISHTLTITGTGANGMDTGSAPTSGYICVYSITKGDGSTFAVLGSNSATNACATIYPGASMPSGYVASGLVGIWPTDSSSPGHLVPGLVLGNRFWYSPACAQSTSLTGQTTLTSQTISACVPATVVKTVNVLFGGNSTHGANSAGAAGNASGIGIVQCSMTANAANVVVGSNTFFGCSLPDIPVLTSQTIFLVDTGGNTDSLFVQGFTR